MRTVIVVSDLHLGDGDPLRDQWHGDQQAAWERLLRAAAPGGPLADGPIELVTNGDCFDFLEAAPPLSGRTHTDAGAGLAKLERIIAAHPEWFEALRAFLAAPDRAATFLIGNHDLELAFPAVRSRLRAAIGHASTTGPDASPVRFCLARAYRPLPDIAIEHGCQVDPANRIPSLWLEPDLPATPEDLEAHNVSPAAAPSAQELPWGSRYYYDVLLPIMRRFPYLEGLLPSLPQSGVAGILCLYAPDLIIEGMPRVRALRDDSDIAHPPDLAPLPAAGVDPATLYAATVPDINAIQALLLARVGAPPPDPIHAAQSDDYTRAIHTALAAADELAALRAIFALGSPTGGFPRDLAGVVPPLDAAAARTLARDPAVRVAVIGHTHVEGAYAIPREDGAPMTLINTGTWIFRLAAPKPAAIDARTARWLRDPASSPTPLAPAPAFTYAILRAQPGASTIASLHTVGETADLA